jgi:uncharacterized protein (TIGR03435 family)
MQAFLLESAVRATLIAAIIALVLVAMRIKTASVLHAVWAGVVILMLLLPALVAWGPKASLPVLPPERSPVIELLPPPSPAGLAETAPRISPVRQDGGYTSLDPIAAIYLLGLGLLLLRLAIGTVRAKRLTSASCVVPVTVGLLHARIILPESSREWPKAQLDAVLAHEGEHIRRRDPLFQWIALLNRAIFWFHPLAWWLERRLSGLAEEACDAVVLARGYDPREYSEYLLDLARSVQRSGSRIEAVGMAMPGIGLKHRIAQILSGVPMPRFSRPRMACTVAVCAAAAAILAAGTVTRAQQQSTPRPAFEVASVKPNKVGGGFSIDTPSGSRLMTANTTLKFLVQQAYRVQEFQVSGGPSWFNTERYDIVAKAASPTSGDQLMLMLQVLLEDRFKLNLHKDKKVVPAYSLVVGKTGSKLHEASLEGSSNNGFRIGTTRLSGRRVSMSGFADVLSQLLGHPVSNGTALSGFFDLRLEWSPDETQPRVPQGAVLDTSGPSIFTAVQEQLGLKLESTKAPVDVRSSTMRRGRRRTKSVPDFARAVPKSDTEWSGRLDSKAINRYY